MHCMLSEVSSTSLGLFCPHCARQDMELRSCHNFGVAALAVLPTSLLSLRLVHSLTAEPKDIASLSRLSALESLQLATLSFDCNHAVECLAAHLSQQLTELEFSCLSAYAVRHSLSVRMHLLHHLNAAAIHHQVIATVATVFLHYLS